jgi:transposase
MTVKINYPHIAFVLQDEIRRSDEARYDHRLHAVLLVAKGMSCPAVADYLGDSERTVRFWIRRYQEDGLQGLIENERSGRPPRITEKQMKKIESALRKTPEEVGLNGGIWDGKSLSAYIRRDFGVALGTRQCQRMFSQLGFRLRKPRPMIAHSDPEIQKLFKKKSEDF